MDEIVSLIRDVGFPIAVAVALFWKNVKDQEQHKAEADRMTEALNNNTIALTELKDKIGG